MEAPPSILLIVLTIFILLIQGLVATHIKDDNLTLKRRLEIINKPATKTFVTKHGDILDCIDIHKQYAFDHPLLKNHTIQMKPTSSAIATNRSSESTSSQFLPENMRCPEGTVPIKRIQKEDLLMEKFTPLSGTRLPFRSSNNVSNDDKGHYEIAGIIANAVNLGASASINVWSPQVEADQYSSASLYSGSGNDAPTSNVVQAGWIVYPALCSSDVRLFTYWTKDGGQKTGCYNLLCPGFVQVSQKIYLGAQISPVSRRWKTQYYINVEIRQDIRTKNWWLYYAGEGVGYWPAALFDTLAKGGTRAGWAGEVYTPHTKAPPDMGSGYQGDLGGYTRVCHMYHLNMLSSELFPQSKDLRYVMTSPQSYKVVYDKYVLYGNYIYFGGPKPFE